MRLGLNEKVKVPPANIYRTLMYRSLGWNVCLSVRFDIILLVQIPIPGHVALQEAKIGQICNQCKWHQLVNLGYCLQKGTILRNIEILQSVLESSHRIFI